MKIFQGFRMAAGDVLGIMNVVNSFRPWVNAEAERMLDNFMEESDKHKLTPDADSWMLWLKLREEVIRKKGKAAPNINTDFSISLFPASFGGVIGIVYTEHPEWYCKWLEMDGVEDFSFWTNTDKPSHISDDEWTARANEWEKVKLNVPVCTQALSIDIVPLEGPTPKFLR